MAVLVHITTECPACDGRGEQGYEPHDWWYGSGVNVITSECRTCQGYGHVDVDTARAYRDSPEPEWDGP